MAGTFTPECRVALVAATSRNGVIGASNDLPWYLPADLRHFKELTTGHTVIMGRKTYESIIARRGGPLPDRTNIVVSRNEGFRAPGAVVAHSLPAAFAAAATDDAFIIGGAQIYAQAMPTADVLHLTEIEVEVDGDAFFPPIDGTIWKEVSREAHGRDTRNPHDFAFVTYTRV